jgi:hypothetical protein
MRKFQHTFLTARSSSVLSRTLLFFASTALLSACHAQQAKVSVVKDRNEGYTLLGLLGYNYTDRDIDDYSVDGAGGGNVILSSPTSGGSGVTCCVKLSNTYKGPIRVKVRWQVDGCKYLIKDDRTGRSDEVRHFYYKETEVDVHRTAENKLGYIETHFYPDGTVKVQLTEHASHPRFVLDENRPDKSFFPRCKDDKKPEG